MHLSSYDLLQRMQLSGISVGIVRWLQVNLQNNEFIDV